MTARAALILSVLAALLALASPAAAATRAAAASAPTGLHAFLLRVDEPRTDVFSRTPSFAWNPVPGAVHYEFQLSTSGSFQDSGIVFSDTSLTSPVAAPALTLPWITGTPHALYARVRAVLDDTTHRLERLVRLRHAAARRRRRRSRATPACCAGRRSTAPSATRSGSSTSRRPSR